MHRIAYLQPTPTHPETVVLQISTKEHEELQKDPLAWVNKNKVFSKDVSSAKILHTAEPKKGETAWHTILIHQLSCTTTIVSVPI